MQDQDVVKRQDQTCSTISSDERLQVCAAHSSIALKSMHGDTLALISTRQVTRATHVRNRICPRVKLILKIIIIMLIICLGFIKSKPC